MEDIVETDGLRVCRHCRQWGLREDDVHCGYCGALNVPFALSDETVWLATVLGWEGRVSLANLAGRPLTLSVVPLSPECRFVRLAPETAFVVPPGERRELCLRLEPETLPEALAQTTVRFEVVLEDNPRLRLPLTVGIVAGPALVAEPGRVLWRNVLPGSALQQAVRLTNQGGLPLTVTGLELSGGPALSFVADLALPLELAPGQETTLSLDFDAAKAPEAETWEGGLRLLLKDMEPVELPVTAQLYRVRLEAVPEAVVFDPCLVPHRYTTRLELRNTGTEPIEVLEVSCPDSWLGVVTRDRLFTLGTPGDAGFGALPSAWVDIVVHAGGLAPGKQETTIRVRTNAGQGVDLDIPVRVRIVLPRPEPYAEYIGIDFGTTASVVAVFDGAANAAGIVEARSATGVSSPLIPSVLVMLRPDPSSPPDPRKDDFVIGDEARSLAEYRAAETVRSIKHIMGRRTDRVMLGKAFTPPDFAACIIRRLTDMAEAALYDKDRRRGGGHPATYAPVVKAMVTVPANFYDQQIRGILEACALAGLDTGEAADWAAAADEKDRRAHPEGVVIDEPSAAAIYYLDKLLVNGRLVSMLETRKQAVFLIYDHGGGTLDVSVVDIRLDDAASAPTIRVKVLASKGNNTLGGDSLDLALMASMVESCAVSRPSFDKTLLLSNFRDIKDRAAMDGWSADSLGRVLRSRDVWKEAAEKVKIDLSASPSATFAVDAREIGHVADDGYQAGAMSFEKRIGVEELRAVIEEPLRQCRELILGALELAERGAADVDYVVHTGRSSLMPLLQETVAAVFPDLTGERHILEPDELKVCVAKGAALYGAMRLERADTGVVLEDVGRRLPHAYGLGRRQGVSRHHVFDALLPIGTACPAVAKYDCHDRQLRLYQNTGRKPRIEGNPDVTFLGSVDVAACRNGSPICQVRFEVDANRTLTVEVAGRPVTLEYPDMQEDERWSG